jgi:hypothetical protein
MKLKYLLNLLLLISLVFTIPINISFAIEGITASTGAVEAKQIGDVKSTCGVPFNVKESLILSTVTMCIPGMLGKGKEWKDNKCQLVVCKYDAIINNLDPSFCEKQDAYKTCKYIVGEAFAIPPMNILEYFRDMMASILANPIGIAYGAAVTGSRFTMSATCSGTSPPVLCNLVPNVPLNIAVPLVVFTDASAVIQFFKDMSDNGFDYLSPSVDYCERVPEIKEELENILKELESTSAPPTTGGSN